MASYSFLDVTMSISGPGGSFSCHVGAANEGITWTPLEDANTMDVGAQGTIQHSLRESNNTGELSITLLKVAHVNQQLRALYESQRSTAATWGMNVINIYDRASGETWTITEAAFKTVPNVQFQQDAGTVQWTFQGRMDTLNMGHAPGLMYQGRNI